MLAYFWVVLEIFPQVVLALVTLGGGIAVAHGALSLGGLVAFVSLFLMLHWPIDSLGWLPRWRRRPTTAAERIYEVLDTRPPSLDRPARAADAGRRRPAAVRTASASATRAPTGTVLHDVDLELAPGETVARGRGHRLGQDHADRAGPAAVRRDRRPGPARRHRRPRPPAGPAAAGGRDRVRGPDAVLGQRPGEPDASAGPTRPTTRSREALRRRPGRVRPRPAVGPRHPARRAGPDPLRRAAAAARAGPRRARPAARAGARRPAVRAGRAHRGAGRGRRCAGCCRHDRAGGGAPPVHRAARRPGRAAGRRHDRRGRHALASCSRRSPRTGDLLAQESDLEEVAS